METGRRWRQRMGDWLADYLSRPLQGFDPPAVYSADQLGAVLQPGDVLLVEGNLRISSMIKYITQSTWSHVALYVGPQPGARGDDPPVLVEAELSEGVVLSPLSKYANFHTRICRAIGLRAVDRERIVAHALARVGHDYDLKNVIDLARQRLSRPSLAASLKRGLSALGSGEPTRGDLLDADRAGVPERSLSDPGGAPDGAVPRYAARRHRRLRRGGVGGAPFQPVHAARLRRFALLHGRQAAAGRRFRLYAAALGDLRARRHCARCRAAHRCTHASALLRSLTHIERAVAMRAERSSS